MKENDVADLDITDEAVEAAARLVFLAKRGVDWDFAWSDEAKRAEARQDASWFARRALQAALPLLAPQPVVDREALFRLLHEQTCICDMTEQSDWMRGHVQLWNERTDAVLALLNGAAK